MRKVEFTVNGKKYDGYYVGLNGHILGSDGINSIIVVEDLEGNIYSVFNDNVKFVGKPINLSPVKHMDLKLMRNVITSYKEIIPQPFTIHDLIKLADEKNIILEDSEF